MLTQEQKININYKNLLRTKKPSVKKIKINNIETFNNKLYKSDRKLNKRIDYKNNLRQQKIDTYKEKEPLSYISSQSKIYEKSGKLSNNHKKYLNLLEIPRVIKKGCDSCSISIDPL